MTFTLSLSRAAFRWRQATLPGRSPGFLGHEALGEVVEVGPAVRGLAPGDRVVMDGSNDCLSMGIDPPCRPCAEGNRIVCYNTVEHRGPQPVGGGWGEEFLRHESNLFKVPVELSDEEAVLLEPASNGVRAALRAEPLAGERALVIGAGTIGLMTIQALRAAEPLLDITAAVLFERQAEEAVARGADRALVRGDLFEAAARLAGARVYTGLAANRVAVGGFDLVCDCVGSAATLGTALRCTRACGRVVLVGAALAPLKIDLTPVWYHEIDIRGMRSHGVEEWKGIRMPSYQRATSWVLEKKMRLAGMVTHHFPLSQYRSALSLAAARDKRRNWSLKIAFDLA